MENSNVPQVLAPALAPMREPQVTSVMPHDKGFGCVRNIVSAHPFVCSILVVLLIILIVLAVRGMLKKSTDNFIVMGSKYQVPITHDAPPPKELKIKGDEEQTTQTYQEMMLPASSPLRPDVLSDDALIELLNGRHASDAVPDDGSTHDE